ncbi:F-box protein [Spatholobus suberectus]|nr:F-box protein [Spatholobus suberectus]
MIGTLGTDFWRRIREFPSLVPLPQSENLKESYKEVLQPDYERETMHNLTLHVLRDCLCVLDHGDRFFDVWLMKDYGKKESWTKLYRVPYFRKLEICLPVHFVCLKMTKYCLRGPGQSLLFTIQETALLRSPRFKTANIIFPQRSTLTAK